MKFYGRERETSILLRQQDIVRKGGSRFVVLTGRRRVGKTRLILEALDSSKMPFIYDFVYKSTSEERNVAIFSEVITDALHLDHPFKAESFEDALLFIFKRAEKEPIALIFDEFQNFDVVSPTMFETLQKLWDLHKNRMQLLLVVSGSVTSAIRNIFENGRAPLYARQDVLLYLPPFTPTLLKKIFRDYCPNFDGETLLGLYILTGGVAQYVETMLEAGVFTTEGMIECLFNGSNRILSEATTALAAEFKGNSAVYFDILRLIASGETKRSSLLTHFKEDISGHLYRLEHVYRLIERVEPVGQTNGQRNRIRFEITDELLNFWFTFLEPKQLYLEAGKSAQIYRSVLAAFPEWSGRSLERFYRKHFESLGCFTEVGCWWGRKGLNEIDLIAVDDLSRKIVFCEIKRNEAKIDLNLLRVKATEFVQLNPKYASYRAVYRKLSLTELGGDSELPSADSFLE